MTFGLVIALVLAVLAFYQRNLAEERRRLARARELATEARFEISSIEDGLQRSTLLAIESLNSAWTLDGFVACANAIRRLPRRPVTRAAHVGRIHALALGGEGRWLASGGMDGKIVIWDTRAQKPITPDMLASDTSSAALAFSRDGRWLASASAQAALIWDTATWKLVKELPHPDSQAGDRKISSVAFNPDGSLLATTTRHSPIIAIYDTATWEGNARWAEAMKEPGAKAAHVAAFSGNGKWLVTGGDGLTIWDTATKKKRIPIKKVDPWSLAFSEDGRILAFGGLDGRLQLLKIPEDFEPVERVDDSVAAGDGGGSISALAFNPHGNRLASAGFGGAIARVWNVPLSGGQPSAGQPEVTLELPCTASAVVFSPEGRAVITGDSDGTIATWPLTNGAAAEVLPHAAAVTAVTFSQSGALLVTASDVLRVFKADAGGWSVVAEKKLPGAATTVGFSPDGLWLVAIAEKTVHFFSSGTWAESAPALAHARDVVGVSFSPDGKWIATRTARENARTQLFTPSRTQIWDLTTRSEVAWATHPDEDYREIRTRSDQQPIVPETGGDTKLVPVSASWEALRIGKSDLRSSDGRWSVDHGGRLSEVRSGREVELVKHEDDVKDAVFSPDGRWLVTASSDKSVRFWPLRTEELRAEALARLGRNLTYDEWRRFFPDEPYLRTCLALPVHPSVRDKARELATAGDVDGATELFRLILKAEPASPFDPAGEARKLAEEGRRTRKSAQDNSAQPSQSQTP